MSANTAGTRIFGMRVTIDPKFIIGGLVLIAGLLFWYNSGDESSGAPATQPSAAFNPGTIATAPVVASLPAIAQRRKGAPANEHATLSQRAIDGTRGDVDPTLRLDLLRRLASLQPTAASRSLFEAGALAPSPSTLPVIKGPILPVTAAKPLTPTTPQGPVTVPLNIPLKYYGYVRPSGSNATNKGFFLDGDIVLAAAEGDVLNQRFLVVELTPISARLEDTKLKQGQTLAVVPQAVAQ